MKKIAVIIAGALVLASCVSVRAKKPFTVDINGPRYTAGSAEAQFDKVLGSGLKKEEVNVYYYPDDDAVCLEFVAETLAFCQFWSREGREAYVAALERYKADFEGRNLAAKSSKTKRAYGKAQGYLSWSRSMLRILAEQARGVVDIELGYTFKEKMPFFTVLQRTAEYKDSGSREQKSPIVTLYFTRAQAEEIAAMFEQEYLDGLEQTGGTQQDGLKEMLRNLLNLR